MENLPSGVGGCDLFQSDSMGTVFYVYMLTKFAASLKPNTQPRKDHKHHSSRGIKVERLTGLEDADDQVHCMDQLQVHEFHA